MLVAFMATLVDGLDVASLREMQLATTTGISPASISYAGPGKTAGDLAAAVGRRRITQHRVCA